MNHQTLSPPRVRQAQPVSLNDAMQVGFDKSQLANESDASLSTLQAKADTAIAGWDRLGRALVPCETAWYNALHELTDYVGCLLTTRYGCND